MGFYAVWPIPLCLGLLLAITALPAFTLADTPPGTSQNRVPALDGLRGFAALSVFFAHAGIYHDYVLTGDWAPPPVRIYHLLGPFGVDMFFMTTGYLFWAIMIRDAGRPAWLKLFAGRVFRIGPLYFFAITLLLAAVLWRSGFHLRVPPFKFFKSVIRVYCLGLFSFRPINGDARTNELMAGVTWTLQYEWLFYAALPLLARAARRPMTHVLLPALVLAGLLFYIHNHRWPQNLTTNTPVMSAALFCLGMICASIHALKMPVNLPNWLASILVILLVGTAFCFCPHFFAKLPILLLGLAFFLIVSGCDVFHLLTIRPARRLGNASYGIYLLQGLVLAGVFSVPPMTRFALASPLQYWAVICFTLVLLVVIATAAHALIEQPGITLGKTVIRMLSKIDTANCKQNLTPGPAVNKI